MAPFAAAAVLVALPGAPAGAASDSTPPKLVSGSATPTTLDISAGDATTTVDFRATDDLSGVDYGFIYWLSPNHNVARSAYASGRISGTATNGVYEGYLTIPQYSQVGSWTPYYAYVYDKVGNYAYYSSSDLTQRGVPNLTVRDDSPTAPSSPNNVTGYRADGSVDVYWDAPTDTGNSAVTSYTVTASPGGQSTTVSGNPAQQFATVYGLDNGTPYTFTVTATNSAGTSPNSYPSDAVTPATVPGRPTAVTAVPGNGNATVNWSAPNDDGGDSVTSYTVIASPGGASTTVTGFPPGTSATVFGLTNGVSYTFSVQAANSVGGGSDSQSSAAVTPVDTSCTITGTAGSDILNGTAGDDVICGLAGNDVIRASAGRDIIIGGDGTDSVTYAAVSGPITADLRAGSTEKPGGVLDTLSGVENLTGTGAADQLTGDDGKNTLDGGGGNDLLVGLGGNDVLRGSEGDDTILPGLGANGADGGAGSNTLSYEDSPVGVAIDTLQGTAVASNNGISDSVAHFQTVIGSQFLDGFSGTPDDDVFFGRGGDDRIGGLGGHDLLFGEEGNDRFYSEADSDDIDGGDGTDSINFPKLTSGVTVNLTLGTASSSQVSDTLTSVENVNGSQYADVMTGDAGPNVLLGGNGNDVIEGRGGNDVLNGQGGTDTVSFAGSPYGVYVNLQSARSYGESTDVLTSFENIAGSTWDDSLIGVDGTKGANVIHGGRGADSIYGLGGNDRLYGDDGTDYLSGGAGADLLDGGAGNDYLDGGTERDTCTQGLGKGTVTNCP